MTNNGPQYKSYENLEQGLKYLLEMADTQPVLALAMRLIKVGQRLEADSEFNHSDVAEIADLLLQDRDPQTALEFLERVEERQPRTMLHRAVVNEISRRSRVGCG